MESEKHAPKEQNVVLKISEMHKEMRKLTLEAGVDECVYDKILETDLAVTEREINRKLKFLEGVYPLFLEMKRIYELVPPQAWHNYKMFGFRKLNEQKALNSARHKVCNRWNRRYGKKITKDIDKHTEINHEKCN